MKTIKHTDMFSDGNFEKIKRDVRKKLKKKSRAVEVQDILDHWDEVKAQIISDIKNRKLKHFAHRAWVRREGIKDRIVCQPSLNRIRPELIYQYIFAYGVKDELLKGQYFLSVGSLEGKGVHFGKKYLEKYIRKHNCRYVLQLDIKKFYQNINTELLKYMVEKRIKDQDMLYLTKYLIDNNVAILNDGTIIANGLLIGAYSSQILGNFYLQKLDHYIKEKLGANFYMRNMDDMVIIGNNKRELRRIYKEIKTYARFLGLEIKPNWQVYKYEHNGKGRFIDYLGFKFYRSKTTVRKRIFFKFIKVLNKIKKFGLNLKCAKSVIAYKGWFKHTDTKHFFMNEVSNVVSINKCKKLISKGEKDDNNILQFSSKRKTA